MNEMMNELMLIISTISSVTAGVTALISELRARRQNRAVSDATGYFAAQSLNAPQLTRTP
jgi:hypothetical protein